MKFSKVLCLLLPLLFFSCKKEKEISTDASLKLEFSSDSILFDTVFTSQGTAFQYLWVYNRHSSPLEFEKIRLSKGASSDFDLLINGDYVNAVSGFYFPANDSMLFLIRANINPQNLNAPFLVEENLDFIREGRTQSFPLLAYGRDAEYRNNYTCACSETWTSGKPYVLSGEIIVPATCTLQVSAGANLFFHSGASLRVEGTLLTSGTFADPVIIHSDRLDDTKKAPGSWHGISFHATSHSNTLEWTELAGASTLFQYDYTADGDTIAELTLLNCTLSNSEGAHLLLNGADFYGYNLLAHTSIGPLIEASNATVYVEHGTCANLSSFVREKPSIVLQAPGKYRFRNSIVWGNRSSEFEINGADLQLEEALIKGTGVSGTGIIENSDPLFEASYNQNFRLKENSPALNEGAVLSGLDKDLDDNLRDAQPDLGAYERLP